MLKKINHLKCTPFQVGVALYIICNALLTFNPKSAVLISLWELIGGYSLAAICYQLFAGISIIWGMIVRKINIEAMGLIMAGSTFVIRALALLTDNDITIQDINTSMLAALLVGSSCVRVWTLYKHSCPGKI